MGIIGHIVIVTAWIAVFAGNTAAEGATGTVGVSLGKPEIDILLVQSRLYKIQQTLSGSVARTDGGLVLLTEEGAYRLRGISLEERIGRDVAVTGIVQDDSVHKSVYVIKIDKNP